MKLLIGLLLGVIASERDFHRTPRALMGQSLLGSELSGYTLARSKTHPITPDVNYQIIQWLRQSKDNQDDNLPQGSGYS